MSSAKRAAAKLLALAVTVVAGVFAGACGESMQGGAAVPASAGDAGITLARPAVTAYVGPPRGFGAMGECGLNELRRGLSYDDVVGETLHVGQELRAGDRLDRHELVCVLAQGGMGAIWLARMCGIHGFERLVALKTILPAFSADEKFRAMFLDEARLASRIHHENVVGIVDVGEARGQLYFAMEYVEGFALTRLHKKVRESRGEFPMAIALRIVAEACGGLHAAHELRDDAGSYLDVVHRDVSPQNLLITPRGNVKVIDFGVARARDRLVQATEAGTLKGKIHYMAPEQARGGALDRRADVYGLGAVLHYLVTGTQVHESPEGGQLQILHMLMQGVPHKPVPLFVPAPIARVIERSIAPDPQFRFDTMEEMLAAIEAAARETGLLATSDDVARLVEEELGDVMRDRRQAIQRAVAAVKNRPRESAPPPNEVPTTVEAVARPPVHAMQPVQGTQPLDSTGEGATARAFGTTVAGRVELPRPVKKHTVFAVASLAVLSLVVFVGAVSYGNRTQAATSSVAAPPSPEPALSPSPSPEPSAAAADPEPVPAAAAAAAQTSPMSAAPAATAQPSASHAKRTAPASTGRPAKHATTKARKSEFLDDGF